MPKHASTYVKGPSPQLDFIQLRSYSCIERSYIHIYQGIPRIPSYIICIEGHVRGPYVATSALEALIRGLYVITSA